MCLKEWKKVKGDPWERETQAEKRRFEAQRRDREITDRLGGAVGGVEGCGLL